MPGHEATKVAIVHKVYAVHVPAAVDARVQAGYMVVSVAFVVGMGMVITLPSFFNLNH